MTMADRSRRGPDPFARQLHVAPREGFDFSPAPVGKSTRKVALALSAGDGWLATRRAAGINRNRQLIDRSFLFPTIIAGDLTLNGIIVVDLWPHGEQKEKSRERRRGSTAAICLHISTVSDSVVMASVCMSAIVHGRRLAACSRAFNVLLVRSEMIRSNRGFTYQNMC